MSSHRLCSEQQQSSLIVPKLGQIQEPNPNQKLLTLHQRLGTSIHRNQRLKQSNKQLQSRNLYLQDRNAHLQAQVQQQLHILKVRAYQYKILSDDYERLILRLSQCQKQLSKSEAQLKLLRRQPPRDRVKQQKIYKVVGRGRGVRSQSLQNLQKQLQLQLQWCKQNRQRERSRQQKNKPTKKIKGKPK